MEANPADKSKNRPLIIENNDFLFRLGIYIPGKEKFPNAVIKFKNSDFIVEEIQPDGTVININCHQDSTPAIVDSVFYHATLVKNNLKTTDAVRELARILNIRIDDIGYYGLKDDDAVTSQRISIRNANKNLIASAKSQNFFLKDIIPAKSKLVPGQALGNRFSIIIRFDNVPNIEPIRRILDLNEIKFINYFYTQRFLAPRLSNFYWAIFILKKDPEEAIRQFLTQSNDSESPFEQSVRAKLSEVYGDWNLMHQILSDNNTEGFFDKELTVVSKLQQYQNPLTALNSIADQVKIWLYSLSSWFFNHKIAEFIKLNKELPVTLPMYLSNNIEDTEIYKEFGEKFGIYPPNTAFIKRYFNVDSFGSKVPTRAKVKIINWSMISSKSLKLTFDLSTGAYATTFLSHFLNLMTGNLNSIDIERDEFINEITDNDPERIRTIEIFK